MSVVVVPADPPREGLVLSRLVETSSLSPAAAADLYAAALKDVVTAAAASGGDLLVNYRPDDELPEEHCKEESAQAAVRATVGSALADLDSVRFEKQVGSTTSARIGNTVTHLLDAEEANSVIVVDPTAVLAGRTVIDSAAMTIRSNEVVLGPSTGSRVHLSAFSEPIDFEDAYETPTVETLTARATDADLNVGFVAFSPVLETGEDLATLVSTIRARAVAGRIVPEHTLAEIEEQGLWVVEGEGGPAVSVGTDTS